MVIARNVLHIMREGARTVPIVRVLTARVVTVLSVPMATVRNVLHIIVKVVTVPIVRVLTAKVVTVLSVSYGDRPQRPSYNREGGDRPYRPRFNSEKVVIVLSVPMATVRNVLHTIVKVVTVPIVRDTITITRSQGFSRPIRGTGDYDPNAKYSKKKQD